MNRCQETLPPSTFDIKLHFHYKFDSNAYV